VSVTGEPLGGYQRYFAKKIVELAKQSGARVVFLHIPYDDEFGATTMREREAWSATLGMDAPMIGISAATLFGQISQERYLHFFVDQHLNSNGRKVFTSAVIPGIVKFYDDGHTEH
jgi:hypothetical protein